MPPCSNKAGSSGRDDPWCSVTQVLRTPPEHCMLLSLRKSEISLLESVGPEAARRQLGGGICCRRC